VSKKPKCVTTNHINSKVNAAHAGEQRSRHARAAHATRWVPAVARRTNADYTVAVADTAADGTGWNIGDGLAPGTPYAAGSSKFLWSEETRRRSWSLGRRSTVVVGAPWIYLVSMNPDPTPDRTRERTIWYPFHGWEGQHILGDHQALIDSPRVSTSMSTTSRRSARCTKGPASG
jgi:hypothetical protein